MRRAFARIGEEMGIGPEIPQRPLRLARPERVEDFEPETQRLGQIDRARECRRGVGVEIAARTGIDRLAREIRRGGVSDLEDDAVARGGDGLQRHDRIFLARYDWPNEGPGSR